MTKTTTGPRPCECSLWTAEPDGTGTGCQATTKKLYSQGHDQAFASWLAKAHAAGKQVRRGDGGDAMTPVDAAASVALHYDIAARAARLAAKRSRKAKATKQPEPEPLTATIKLGRWTYDNATIAPSGEASYTTKDGKAKTAAAGSYKVLLAEVAAGAE
jgi:hypothetical protein